ncbi:ABC transporter permease, partial [bacterium]
GIDLSIGSTIALSTVVVARLLAANQSPLVAALGGIGAGLLAGLLIGLLVTKLKLSPFIVTLGTLGAYRGLAKGLADETVVQAPTTGLNTVMSTLTPGTKWMIFPPGVWITLLLGVLVAAMLRYTRFGRHIFAIGSSEATARLCGVPVDLTKLGIYTLGAALAGVAGVLQFSFLTIGDPTTASGYELSAIAAVVIGGASLSGGQGSILGSLLGATLMTVIANGGTKMNLPNWVQEIVTGVIIVLAVTLDRLRHRSQS